MAGHVVQTVDAFGELLKELMQRAEEVKQTHTVEPPLNKTDFEDILERVETQFFSSAETLELRKQRHAAIDTAIRDKFNDLLSSTTIDTPSFVQMWNLLDIISILSDDEQCDTALLFWLVEELLDSQTIAGCRRIFDYLESRREKITGKHFSQKNLVILRSCNELLRRLSRAEDTAFCGRVFIFMFQSFPLGDRSSVNLRGEYHTENVTAFDVLPDKDLEPEQMDVDSGDKPKLAANGAAEKANEEPQMGAKGVTFSKPETRPSADELYPIFWSLQETFNQPKKLFDATNFAGFKTGLESTMAMFKSVQNEIVGRPVKAAEDGKRGTKRKRSQVDEDLANAFNPKYLTSKDLFELEISDLSFRRNILVQVLIVLDFLLSLSARSKEKLAKANLPDNLNKSVLYADQLLAEDDANWALDMKRSIAEYLKQGFEGAFFYRMVETVLSRDKNWARWKIENCPSIARPAVAPESYVAAKASAIKATNNKRLRPTPMGSLDLKFLSTSDGLGGLDRLKDPTRYQLPSIKSFEGKIELDDMDIDMAKDEDSKNLAIESKASKSWRALRLASTSKLVAFDKIERSDKIDGIFQEDPKQEEQIVNREDDSQDTDEPSFPKDRRPIVISGPSGVGKGTLINMLMDKHAKVFGRKASHTTRASREGEVHGEHYFFVSKEDFNIILDGDGFLEYNNYNGNDYGTSKKVLEGIIAQGKVPIVEVDMHGVQQLKDQEYSARFIFIGPPDLDQLDKRLRQRGSNSDEQVQERLDIANKEIEQSKLDRFHDTTIINDDLEAAYKNLEHYIFDNDNGDEPSQSTSVDRLQESLEAGNTDVEMTSGDGGASGLSKEASAPLAADSALDDENQKI